MRSVVWEPCRRAGGVSRDHRRGPTEKGRMFSQRKSNDERPHGFRERMIDPRKYNSMWISLWISWWISWWISGGFPVDILFEFLTVFYGVKTRRNIHRKFTGNSPRNSPQNSLRNSHLHFQNSQEIHGPTFPGAIRFRCKIITKAARALARWGRQERGHSGRQREPREVAESARAPRSRSGGA